MKQRESLVSKIPPEIWWAILYDVLVPKYLLDQVYDGNNWIDDSVEIQRLPTLTILRGLRKQSQDLALVCKLWKEIAYHIKDRFIRLDPNNPALAVDAVQSAWRMDIRTIGEIPLSPTDVAVKWQVLLMGQGVAHQMPNLRYPHVRRLELDHGAFYSFQANDLIQLLGEFKSITWFNYRAGALSSDAEHEGESITLPNLQVLFYTGYFNLCLPFSRLRLPSLRHLYVATREMGLSELNLPRLIDSYGKTLQSLYLDVSFSQELQVQTDVWFPAWDKVPCLQELAIVAPTLLQFHPLLTTHPLRRFAAQVGRIEDLLSWLDSENLKVIRMLLSEELEDVMPVRSDHLAAYYGIGAHKMEMLEAKAEQRGIALELCRIQMVNKSSF